MITSPKNWGSQLALASWLVFGCVIAFSTNCASAQITPDRTLPNNSRVTPSGNTSIIEGGTRAGSNLFHSFDSFSVPTGSTANFNNALDIQNIITRVTGKSISNIDGLIKANGTANLFLINPNGIIFGPNAWLNIGGSFLASTASSLKFSDGKEFSATAPQTTPLLTISVPNGLQFGGNAGNIQVQGNGQGIRSTPNLIDTTVGLRVQPNQTLALVGGNVALSGGTLKTVGGRIELGSVASSGLVSLTPIDKGWALGFEGVPTFGDIQLSKQAAVDASGEGGGDVQIQGRQISLTDSSQIEASTLGSQPGGTLSLNASELVELSGTSANGGSSALSAGVYSEATGAGDNLIVRTGQLNVLDGAEISTSTKGAGSAGDLTIATKTLMLQDGAEIYSDTYSQGQGGNLSVSASDSVEMIGALPNGLPSGLFARTYGAGATRDLTIATGKLIARDGAQVASITFDRGQAGNLSVNASDFVELSGRTPDDQFASGLYARAAEGSTGAAGNLRIDTGKLIVEGGAAVEDITFGQGQGGNLSVNASNSVEIIGISAKGGPGASSGLFAEANLTGAAGNLTIATGKLIVRDGAQVRDTSFGKGNAGTLAVTASDSVELVGSAPSPSLLVPSGLFTQAQDAGSAGDLRIDTRRLVVQNGARVSSSTVSLGKAGNIQVNATSVNLSGVSPNGFSGGLFASTSGAGQGGSITVNTSTFRVADGAIANAITIAKGNGGNIAVNANTFKADNGGQVITTTRSSGRSGNINLNVTDSVTLTGRDPTFDDRLARFGRPIVSNTGSASGLFATTDANSTGDGGTISIDPLKLTLSDGAGIAVSSLGKGNAGNLNIQAGTVALERGSSIAAATVSGEGGNMRLQVQNLLLMRNGSSLSTTASGTGNGGNIYMDIKNGFLVAVPSENSDITANAFTGRGGNINIAASGIYGLEYRSQLTPESDITASSEFGINGTVQINTLGIEPNRGLVNLPAVPVDTRVAFGCTAGGSQAQSSFTVTGRGGLPPNPSSALNTDAVQVDLVTLNPQVAQSSTKVVSTSPPSPTSSPIVEATGWAMDNDGNVVLTANASTVTPHSPRQKTADCRAFNQHPGG